MSNSKDSSARKGADQLRDRTLNEVSIWIRLASILPLTVISFMGLCYLIGLDNLVEIVSVFALTGFLAVASVWWWWSVNTIIRITRIMNTAYTQFDDIQKNLQQLKKDIDRIKKLPRE